MQSLLQRGVNIMIFGVSKWYDSRGNLKGEVMKFNSKNILLEKTCNSFNKSIVILSYKVYEITTLFRLLKSQADIKTL